MTNGGTKKQNETGTGKERYGIINKLWTSK